MRSLILLGCVLFASACDVVAPEDATTVRIVDVAHPSTRSDPFLLRIQNIGIAGSYHAKGVTGMSPARPRRLPQRAGTSLRSVR